jgi:methyl-accepting chemotaxis protein
MKLAVKMPVTMASLITASIAAVGVISVLFAHSALRDSAAEKLLALVDARSAALVSYLETIHEDLELTAANEVTQKAMVEFTRTYSALGGGAVARRLYVDENANKGKLWDLMQAPDGSAYSAVHAAYHP